MTAMFDYLVNGGDELAASLEHALGLLGAEVEDNQKLRSRIASLGALLRIHLCNADGSRSVGACIDAGYCGCSCGLLLK